MPQESLLQRKLKQLGLEDAPVTAPAPKKLDFKIYFPQPPHTGLEYRAAMTKEGYNFVGLVLGHHGSTIQHIQKVTGARIEIRDRNGNLNGDHPRADDPELHALVLAETKERLLKAVQMVADVLAPTNSAFQKFPIAPGGSTHLRPLPPSKPKAARNGGNEDDFGPSSPQPKQRGSLGSRRKRRGSVARSMSDPTAGGAGSAPRQQGKSAAAKERHTGHRKSRGEGGSRRAERAARGGGAALAAAGGAEAGGAGSCAEASRPGSPMACSAGQLGGSLSRLHLADDLETSDAMMSPWHARVAGWNDGMNSSGERISFGTWSPQQLDSPESSSIWGSPPQMQMHEGAAAGAFCRDTQPCDPEVADPAPHGHRTTPHLYDAPPQQPQTPERASTYDPTSGDFGGWSPFSSSFLPAYGGDSGEAQAGAAACSGGWSMWADDASQLFSPMPRGSLAAYGHHQASHLEGLHDSVERQHQPPQQQQQHWHSDSQWSSLGSPSFSLASSPYMSCDLKGDLNPWDAAGNLPGLQLHLHLDSRFPYPCATGAGQPWRQDGERSITDLLDRLQVPLVQ